jgi:hypothetical protein
MVLVARFRPIPNQIPLEATFTPRLKVGHIDAAFFLKSSINEGWTLSCAANYGEKYYCC